MNNFVYKDTYIEDGRKVLEYNWIRKKNRRNKSWVSIY